MSGTLKKRTRVPSERGMYYVSGSLDGVVPGRRTVKELDVTRVDGSGEGLAPLRAFRDLRRLQLEHVRDVDLGVLSDLDLELLHLDDVAGVDLGALSLRDGLEWLVIAYPGEDCRVPAELSLPASLRVLAMGARGPGGPAEPIRRILAATDWSNLGALVNLDVRVSDSPPIEVDLSFLRRVSKLEFLRLDGIDHAGPGASPLEPPFDGLSRGLRTLVTDVWEPDVLKDALHAHFGDDFEAAVAQRYPYTPPPAPWTIHAPASAGAPWSTFGSLADAAGMTRDETESKALRAARGRLRAADPALLRRLDFDWESEGTTVMASSREDLVAALRILGLDQG